MSLLFSSLLWLFLLTFSSDFLLWLFLSLLFICPSCRTVDFYHSIITHVFDLSQFRCQSPWLKTISCSQDELFLLRIEAACLSRRGSTLTYETSLSAAAVLGGYGYSSWDLDHGVANKTGDSYKFFFFKRDFKVQITNLYAWMCIPLGSVVYSSWTPII